MCRSLAVALKLLIFTAVVVQERSCRSTAALQYLELNWGGEELLFRRDNLTVEGAAGLSPGAADLERVLLLRGDITVGELQSER